MRIAAYDRGEIEAEPVEDVIQRLWERVTPEERERIDATWLDEVRRREEAYARGGIESSPVEEVIQRVLAK